jgi:hypothetical protein
MEFCDSRGGESRILFISQNATLVLATPISAPSAFCPTRMKEYGDPVTGKVMEPFAGGRTPGWYLLPRSRNL